MALTDEELWADTPPEEIVDEVVPEIVPDEDEVIPEIVDDTPAVYSMKVDGKDVEVSLDELKAGYGKASAADAKFRDAAFARKQAEEFITQLKTDPWKVLNDPSLGLDTQNMAREYLQKQLDFEQLSDEQKELIDARQKLADYEDFKRQQEEQQHNNKMAELEAQYHQQFTTEIHGALEADGLPVTEATVRRMANYMSEAMNSDDPAVQALTAKDVTELVREDYMLDFKQLLGASDAETIQAILGDDVALQLRKADVAKLTAGDTKTTKPVKAASGNNKKSTKMTQDEFDSYLDSF